MLIDELPFTEDGDDVIFVELPKRSSPDLIFSLKVAEKSEVIK